MININTLILGELKTNCYIVSNKYNNEALIIDPANEAYKIYDFLENNKLTPKAILLTHGHFDHITAVPDIKEKYNIPCYSGEFEIELLNDSMKNLSKSFGGYTLELKPDKILSNNQVIELAGMIIKVIETPGHTKGGVSYLFEDEKVIFTGDTLFKGTIGRTDLPTSSYKEILISLNDKLMLLDDDIVVYPGHGYKTTIRLERESNPYVGRKEV